ncbi:hypothetical protein [Flavobacterium urumqiense]|uniref:Uncharacterized protein n=1 Tax=Flavobacterium urumqiense TaxID=935224 RepID=A0A1H5V4N6_9FLAO|nr:hypothetical protein [Flavobacterium urumqiense]SEF82249.1 hypothetical protein SAMN04488130_10360 [Flavobacterium urumqiense]
MVKNKPTYITDLTTEIVNNSVLLSAWAEHSADMKFLELSVAILSDIDLLFSWDCNNVLNLKLAGILSGNQDFKLKSGMLITIDESYKFPFETSSDYVFCIREMLDIKSLSGLFKKDLIIQGHSLEAIEQAERYSKISSFVQLMKETEGYESEDFKYLNEIVVPGLIERKNEVKRIFIDKKVGGLLFSNTENYVKIEAGATELKEINYELDFNRNHWNKKCFELFNYLIDNYEKKGNVKFINVFYFLKRKVDKGIYTFAFTIDQYKTFIESQYGVKLTTFRTAEFDFEDNEIPILNAFVADFRTEV